MAATRAWQRWHGSDGMAAMASAASAASAVDQQAASAAWQQRHPPTGGGGGGLCGSSNCYTLPEIFFIFSIMTNRALSYSRLDELIGTTGEEGLLSLICSRVAEGEKLYDIVRSLGITYAVIWKWLSVGERMGEYESALEARADYEAQEALSIADSADVEGVQVAKLRIDTRLKLIGKWDRRRYGDRVQMDVVNTGVDLQALLDAREAKLVEVIDMPLAKSGSLAKSGMPIEDVELLESGG